MRINPFETQQSLGQINRGKNLGFDEAFLGMQNEDAKVLDDERDHINYRLLVGLILLSLTVVFMRVAYLQVVKGTEYRSLAEGNKLRVQSVLAPRGTIQDRNGKIIAANTANFELVVVTGDLPRDSAQFQADLAEVAMISGQDQYALWDIIKGLEPDSYQAQTLVSDLTKEQALILISKQQDFPGFIVQNNPIRDYHDSVVFTHLVGYTGKIDRDELEAHQGQDYILNDYIGKTGLEVQYEEYLRGIAGKKQTEVDAAGTFKRTLAEVPSQAGNNIKLNIDYDLQKKLYEAMVSVMDERTRSAKAAAIATNPKTGEVLALISLPSFDSNLFARGIKTEEYSSLINSPDNPLLNRVLSGTYPPGSTVKPMLAVAALTEGIVTPSTKILDDGLIRVGSFTFYGYERSGLGIMDIYSAIARSSDIYFYSVGGGNPKTVVKEGLGPERIAEYYRKFHLGSPLGIDLPGEKPGLVPDPEWKQRVIGEKWYLGNTYHVSIGQGDLLVTPLQVNSWTATIANGGKIMQPYILREVFDKTGQVLHSSQPRILAENIFDPQFIKVTQDGMRQAVTDGSARSLANLPVEIAGKTGTAQFDARDLSSTHAWFTSYAPINDPQIALTVLVEAGGEGSSVAVPISREVYQWWSENRWNK